MTRQDLIEGIVGKMYRTATGKRRATNKAVRAAVGTSKDARYAHRKAMHFKKFLKGKSPKNKMSHLTWQDYATMVKHGTTKKVIHPIEHTLAQMRRVEKVRKKASERA